IKCTFHFKQKKRANRPQTLCLSRFRRLFSFSLFCTFHFTPLINIEKINKNIHTIAEIQEEKNAEIIRDKIQGDEILYKEVIDSKIILNCLDTRYISEIFYNLLGGVSHKDKNTTKDVSSKIHEIKLEDCEINLPCTAKDLKFYFIENEASLIGYIDKDNTPHVSPKNDEIIPENSRIIYIK
ncbi:hypothetical protein ACQ1PR_11110, partial [Ornithobacterium rhinotracheale]